MSKAYLQEGEVIVAAAVWRGVTFSMPPPARHGTIINTLHFMGVEGIQPEEQGFITSAGRFVSRQEAHAIAYRMQQCKPDHPTQLFSEDLW